MSSNAAETPGISDDFEFIETESNKNSNFDELDEYMTELNLAKEPPKGQDIQSFDSSLLEEDIERASPIQTIRNAPDTTGKSQFYFPNVFSLSNLPSLADPDLEPLENLQEKFVAELRNVMCLKSENNFLNSSHLSKEIRNNSVYHDGRLILTNYRLVFVPLTNQPIKESSLFIADKRLHLFHHKIDHTISIALTSIHEIKACNTPDKFKKLKSMLDSRHEIKEIVVKCKNFLSTAFILNEKNAEFLNLLSNINCQVIIQSRINHLLSNVNERNSPTSNEDSGRISYFSDDHLKQEIFDCGVNEYMQVKNGCTVKFDTKFWIDMYSPFLVIPTKINAIIKQRRIVINENNVQEFQTDLNTLAVSKDKRFGKFGSFLGSSPKSAKSTNGSSSQTIQFQSPQLAQLSNSNPFCRNGFPFWSFTDTNSGFSLFVIPSANRLEEGDILLKNFNSLICDEQFKIKDIKPNGVKVSDKIYLEYEFFKFKVPFSYHKIESSYQKLFNICSHKSIENYQEDSEDFLSKLNNSKWLKLISETLCLTSKIINSLCHRNVFIEEYRSHLDLSCVLTSLTKICLSPKYRTIVGLENLIQRDWFMTGHNFYNRLNQSESNQRRRSSSEEDKKQETIAPVFLFFLDCLFQLLIQYPNEFEFNEFYLINLWDYSISGLSVTFSFNGMSEFFEYIHSLNDKNTQKNEQINLNDIFLENNKFWLSHLEKSGAFFVNKFFNRTKSEKKKSVLIPCDRAYMLKFWSRCYLRWVEKYHSYNSVELDNDHLPRQAPPLPPKPPKDETANLNEINDCEIRNLIMHDSALANTRITEDGHIETSF